jgi:zinc/manganese transport system substrate-binding protein
MVTSCGSQPASSPIRVSPEAKRLKVTATILPIYLFTKAVAGDAATVKLLISPGTEVHEYQSKPADVQAIAQSDVIIKNGLGLEQFLTATVSSAQNSKLMEIDASRGIQTLVQVSPVVKPMADKGGDAQSHEAVNPHVWLDPVRAQAQVANIRDGLSKADPLNRQTYQANAATYIQQLQQLDRQFQQGLEKCRTHPCRFVTFHDAFPYLANRYQLQQLAVVEIPEDSLTPSDLQKVVAAVKQYNVKTLFSEAGTNNPLLSNLSQDLNLRLKRLDSLEAGEPNPQHYFVAMKNNLQALEAAFK